jgi:hypothetical protein
MRCALARKHNEERENTLSQDLSCMKSSRTGLLSHMATLTPTLPLQNPLCQATSQLLPTKFEFSPPPVTPPWPRRERQWKLSATPPLGPCDGARLFIPRSPRPRAAESTVAPQKAKRVRGIEGHGHPVFHRKLHREVPRLVATQNVIDIGGPDSSLFPLAPVQVAGGCAQRCGRHFRQRRRQASPGANCVCAPRAGVLGILS